MRGYICISNERLLKIADTIAATIPASQNLPTIGIPNFMS
jgi:hypothetical protein